VAATRAVAAIRVAAAVTRVEVVAVTAIDKKHQARG
jgi:hypothetical protein